MRLSIPWLLLVSLICIGIGRGEDKGAADHWEPLTTALHAFPFNFSLSVSDETGLLYLYEKNVDYYSERLAIDR